MTAAAFYCRVSTMDQDNGMQIADLGRLADARGWTLFENYTDEGVSGAKAARPALDRLMADARRRKFDVVAVWRFDRFARSTQHLLAALEEFRALGIHFVSFSEGIDTSTPTGKMVFTFLAALAEFEREIIRERVRAGVQYARVNGVKLGRPAADLDLDKLVAMRAQGLSQARIAKRLGVGRSTVQRALSIVPKNPPSAGTCKLSIFNGKNGRKGRP